MKILIIVLMLYATTGCVIGEEAAKVEQEKRNATGKVRHQLFKECMELAAKIERKGDDDVSDIIDECDSVAYYTANHLTQ